MPYTVESNVSYGPDARNVLDVYTPTTGLPNRPGFINIHGGGWQRGDKTQSGPLMDVAKIATDLGYTVFNINHRLVENADITIIPNPAVVNPAPAAIADAQLAVRWVRTHAADRDLDPSRIYASGLSSGAHLAGYLGVQDVVVPGTSVSDLFPNVSPMVNGVIGNSMPADLAAAIHGPHNEDNEAAEICFVNAQPIPENLEIYNRWSPLALVTSSSVKMYLTEGTHDTTVVPAIPAEMRDALVTAGVPVVLENYNGGHVFFGTYRFQRLQILTRAIRWIVS